MSIPTQDRPRLVRQLDRVRECMLDKRDLIGEVSREWWTLQEINNQLNCYSVSRSSEAGVSARLRDLRKEGLIVDKRRRKGGALYEYRVTPAPPSPQGELFNG